MFLGDLQRLVHPFLDGHRRDHNDELGEAEPFVQFKDRAQIDIGLASAGLHFDGEIARG